MSELLSALQDASLPVLGRWKVACHLYQHGGPRGQVLLLKWACQELCQAYNKRNKTPPPPVTCCKLWAFLRAVLEGGVADDGDLLQETSVLNSHVFQVTVCAGLASNEVGGAGFAGNGRGLLHCSQC